MSKIRITYQDKEYTLGFSRQGIRQLEAQGFSLDSLEEKPMTMIPMLVQGAFAQYNRGMKRALIDEIYDSARDKSGLILALAELYAETLSTLMEEKEDSEGNAIWERAE